MSTAGDLLHSWNRLDRQRLSGIRLEEDIRDALQCVRTTAPSIAQRRRLLELSDEVGIQYAFLGFPAASSQEAALCVDLARHAARESLGIEPVFMARAIPTDVEAIVELQDAADRAVTADIYIGISTLRLAVEGWTLPDALDKLARSCSLASSQGMQFRVSLEDSSRATPQHVACAVHAAADLGAKGIILCDTTGDCLPDGAARHTAFAVDQLAKIGTQIDIGWHGHNDKGLSLANALAAATAGANIISGTFLGIGERTGNIPLEQMIFLLAQAGNERHNLLALTQLCQTLAASVAVDIPAGAPIVGADAFSTSTGTHAAAILKARSFGVEYEDLIYSAVQATSLGRAQRLLIGANSGRKAILAALLDCGLAPEETKVEALLRHCKQRRTCLQGRDEILRVLNSLGQD